MAVDFVDLAPIEKRIRDYQHFLENADPCCFDEQRHLNEGSTESIYWHYGYMMAAMDILRYLTVNTGHSNE